MGKKRELVRNKKAGVLPQGWSTQGARSWPSALCTNSQKASQTTFDMRRYCALNKLLPEILRKRDVPQARGPHLSQLSASSTLGFCKCPGTCSWRVKKKASGHLAETGVGRSASAIVLPVLHRFKERQALAGASVLI